MDSVKEAVKMVKGRVQENMKCSICAKAPTSHNFYAANQKYMQCTYCGKCHGVGNEYVFCKYCDTWGYCFPCGDKGRIGKGSVYEKCYKCKKNNLASYLFYGANFNYEKCNNCKSSIGLNCYYIYCTTCKTWGYCYKCASEGKCGIKG